MNLALLVSVYADEKADQTSADFAAGMEGMNYNGDETKHRPIFILPRPPVIWELTLIALYIYTLFFQSSDVIVYTCPLYFL